MELEHVKESKESTNKRTEEIKNQGSLSPSGSGIEYDISERGSIRKLNVQNSPVSSPMKSPPVQTMGHPPGYDPNRIPSSVFATNTNASEWSATSNESLFSIQMGNNSFSRDYLLMFGKSAELSRIEDWNRSQSNPPGDFPRLDEWSNNQHSKSHSACETKSNRPNKEVPLYKSLSGKLPTEKKNENKIHVVSVENHTKEKPKSSDIKTTPPAEATPPTPPTPPTPTTFSSPPRFSNESGNSGSSFAFPLLVNDATKSNPGSLKVVLEKPEEPQPQPAPKPEPQSKPQSQMQDPKEALNSANSGPRWCFCFPCWSPCG